MNWRIDFENTETERNLLIIENQKLKGLLEEAEALLRIYGDINKATKLLKKIGESK
jgi:hypothetical protein